MIPAFLQVSTTQVTNGAPIIDNFEEMIAILKKYPIGDKVSLDMLLIHYQHTYMYMYGSLYV